MPKPIMWIAVAVAGISGVLLQCGRACRAQTPVHQLAAGPVYTSEDGRDGPRFPRADIVVRITGGSNSPQLRAEDLKLFSGDSEVGHGISIKCFGDADYGVKSILALDASGSMKGAPLAAIHSSVAKFVNQARDRDRVEVLSFADDTRTEVPFGADKSTLANRLQQVTSRGTKTRLYDGIIDALSQLEGPPPAFQQLTVISDGQDEGSRHTIDEAIRKARADKIAIDAIGLTRSHPESLQTLARLAQATGGHYREAKSAEELDGLIDQGIRAMRATPVVTFDADHVSANGKVHDLALRWRPEHLTDQIELPAPKKSLSGALRVWIAAGCCLFLSATLLVALTVRRNRSAASSSAFKTEETDAKNESSAGETVIEEPASISSPRPWAPTIVEETEEKPVRLDQTRVLALFDLDRMDGQPILEATSGPLAGKRYCLSGDFSIGALKGNSLVIPDDPTLSGFHAKIRLRDGVLTVEDNRSTNGTYVNGVHLGQGRKLLKPEDEIRMGRSGFRVQRGGTERQAASTP